MERSERVKQTMENLHKNGIDSYYVENKAQVIPQLKQLIKEGDTVSIGGSVSLFDCGVIEFLREGKYQFLDRYAQGADMEKIYRQAHSADVYLCSSNAVTEQGELYNVDGNSNRVSAIAHGPHTVIMVCGVNKIVKDLDEAIYRVKTVAAPKNCMRLGVETYCKSAGKCQSLSLEHPAMTDGCHTPARICCNYLVSARQRHEGRIKVIFVGETIGA